MPFPWKKVKSARISRLVNDHLYNGQKRRDGSSLVVETGFPTSLVDLFMKNREKLKKSSQKRRHNPTVSDATDSVIAGSPAPFPSPPATLPLPVEESVAPQVRHTPLDCLSPSRSPPHLALPNSRDPHDSNVVRSSGGDESVGSMDAKRASFVYVKLFMVLLIALGTKRLAVGITISAFLLLFLEYAGKRACGFLNPFADIMGVSKLMLQRFCLLFRFKVVKFDEYNASPLIPELRQENPLEPDYSSLKSLGSGRCNQEIQVVEENYHSVSHLDEIQSENELVVGSCLEIQSENELVVGSCLEGSFRYQQLVPDEAVMEEESNHRVTELKTAKSRRAKMKLKLKKIFLKKPPSSRKEHESQGLETVEEIVLCDEQKAMQCHDEGELVISRDSSSISIGLFSSGRSSEVNEVVVPNSQAASSISVCLCSSSGSSEVNELVGTEIQQKQETCESGLSQRHMVLCIIILVGLVGGRGIAILLTLSWYMLLKLVERLPRYMKVPTIQSFVNKSG